MDLIKSVKSKITKFDNKFYVGREESFWPSKNKYKFVQKNAFKYRV